MVDFRKMLSKEALERLDAKHAEIGRLHSLGDRWLAMEILKLARSVRALYPELAQKAHVQGPDYTTTYVWDLIPEIAARLGATDFMAGERSSEIRALSSEDLRDWVGTSTKWIGWNKPMDNVDYVRGVHPWSLLTTEFVNGNPVVFALDRVAPPSPTSPDWCAVHMREIARHRGLGSVSGWSPEVNDFKRKRSEETEGLTEQAAGMSPR